MPSFDIVKESPLSDSFRVTTIRSQFDLKMQTVRERFSGNIDIEDRDWRVGLIYGASGTGKSTIARELFPQDYIRGFDYHAPSILDDMPAGRSTEDIARIFNAVGFSSPPSWMKPYDALSTGEKMRVDIARAILEDRQRIVFDEFTSVVNREVARIGSVAVSKTVRKLGKQFIAVACHDDIIDWLAPDWTFCTNDFSFFLRKDNDPASPAKFENANERYGPCLENITI